MNDKPRLIDANALKKELDAWASPIRNRKFYVRDDAICVIDASPTIDAVPVVRCKDCGNACAEGEQYWCNVRGNLHDGAEYCSQGYAKMDGKDGDAK